MSASSRTAATWPGPATPTTGGPSRCGSPGGAGPPSTRPCGPGRTVLDRATADWPEDDRAALTILMTRLADSLDRLADDPETR